MVSNLGKILGIWIALALDKESEKKREDRQD